MAAGGERFAERVRENLLACADTFGGSLRALRTAAVQSHVARSLHETECLDWLRVLLEAGRALLVRGVGAYGGASARPAAQSEVALLWALEAAVGVVHALLWRLAASTLPDFHDASLFEALVRLSIELHRHPAVAPSRAGGDCAGGGPAGSGLAAAARALDAALLPALALFFEGRWPSRVPQMLTTIAEEDVGAAVGVAHLLARSLPPPLPLAPEGLAAAALVLRPPAPLPLHHSSLSMGLAEACHVAEECHLTGGARSAAASSAPAAAADEGGEPPPEDAARPTPADAAPDTAPVLPTHLHEVLLHALHARRERWRFVLLGCAAAVQTLIGRLATVACRGALVGVGGLLVRLTDVLPLASAKDLLVQPLLSLQAALGAHLADASAEPPPSARGEPTVAAGRVAVLLASLAASPSGRAALLAADAPLLGAALGAALQPKLADTRRAGLLLLRELCDPSHCLALYQVPSTCPRPRLDLASIDPPRVLVLSRDRCSSSEIAAPRALPDL